MKLYKYPREITHRIPIRKKNRIIIIVIFNNIFLFIHQINWMNYIIVMFDENQYIGLFIRFIVFGFILNEEEK